MRLASTFRQAPTKCLPGPAVSGIQYHSNVRANKAQAQAARVPADLCNVPCFKGELVARLRRRMPDESHLEGASSIFAALADRQRLKILHSLAGGEELCVCDIAHVLRVSVSSASHHLRKLRDMGILNDRNDGRMMYYSLREPFVAQLVSQALKEAS